MSHSLLANLQRFAPGRHRPGTFLQRGVAVPFETPMLVGARIRPGERHREMMVVDTTFGQGHFIIPWNGAQDLCTLRAADVPLWEALKDATVLTPTGIRQMVRRIGLTGEAGDEARQAAARADAEDQEALVAQNFRLLMRLVRQTETKAENTVPLGRDNQVNIMRLSQRATRRMTARLNCAPEELSGWLNDISRVMLQCGLGLDQRDTSIASLLARLRQFRLDLASMNYAESTMPSAWLLDETASLNLTCSDPLLRNIERSLDDLAVLLQRWPRDAKTITEEFERPSWLLDGWVEMLALWDRRTVEDTEHILRAMASMVPVLPNEIVEWVGSDAQFTWHQQRLTRFVMELEDWRTGRVQPLRTPEEQSFSLTGSGQR